MRLVRRCRTPRCRARHVTVSPSSISPLIRPATGSSPVHSSERVCRSMLRARSNTRSGGAAIAVERRIVIMGVVATILIRRVLLEKPGDLLRVQHLDQLFDSFLWTRP